MNETLKGEEWECFCDEAYYHKWAVRGKERNRPTISGKEASATPIEFRDLLISIAKESHQ